MTRQFRDNSFVGNKFWYLTIIGDWWFTKKKSWLNQQMALVKCICGIEKKVIFYFLRKWKIKSCWCKRVEFTMAGVKTHWMSRTPIYKVWTALQKRCNCKTDIQYYNYGGRWIECEWKSFEDFYSDMYPTYRKWLSIDRINNEWHYCKENCRRTTQKVQCNNKRTNHPVTVNWETKNVTEWGKLSWIPYNTIIERIKRWYSPYEAVFMNRNWKYKKQY